MQNEPTLKNAQAIANQSQMPKFKKCSGKTNPILCLNKCPPQSADAQARHFLRVPRPLQGYSLLPKARHVLNGYSRIKIRVIFLCPCNLNSSTWNSLGVFGRLWSAMVAYERPRRGLLPFNPAREHSPPSVLLPHS
jgi:hypothetical protein